MMAVAEAARYLKPLPRRLAVVTSRDDGVLRNLHPDGAPDEATGSEGCSRTRVSGFVRRKKPVCDPEEGIQPPSFRPSMMF